MRALVNPVIFEGVLASMVTPFELQVGDDDLADVLDRFQGKRVRVTVEAL